MEEGREEETDHRGEGTQPEEVHHDAQLPLDGVLDVREDIVDPGTESRVVREELDAVIVDDGDPLDLLDDVLDGIHRDLERISS